MNIEPVTHFDKLCTPAASGILLFGKVPSAKDEIGTSANTEPIPNKTFERIIAVGEDCKFKFAHKEIDTPIKTNPVAINALKSYIWQSFPIKNNATHATTLLANARPVKDAV